MNVKVNVFTVPGRQEDGMSNFSQEPDGLEELDHENESQSFLSKEEEAIGDQQLRSWKIKRKKTLVIFVLQYVVGAINFSITLPSMWIYLKQVHSPFPFIFYGIIYGLSQANTLIFSLFVGWIADKTRKIKLILLVVNSLIILGNLIYSIGYSQYVILLGKVLSNLSMATYPVISGEIPRCYKPAELQKVITLCTVGNALGFVLAQCLNLLLKHADIKITGSYHLSTVNAGSVLSMVLYIIMQVLNLIFGHDLSKQIDLKASFSYGNTDERTENKTAAMKTHENSSAIKIVIHLFKTSTISVILFATFLSGCSLGIFEGILSLVASSIFHWKIFDISLVYLVMSVIYIISSLIILKISKQVSEFILILAGATVSTMGFIALCVVGQTTNDYKVSKAFYYIIIGALGLSFPVNRISLQSIMSKLIPSQYQNLAEAVRYSMMTTGVSVGYFIAGVGVQNLIIVGAVFIGINIVNEIFLLGKQKRLLNPTQIDMENLGDL